MHLKLVTLCGYGFHLWLSGLELSTARGVANGVMSSCSGNTQDSAVVIDRTGRGGAKPQTHVKTEHTWNQEVEGESAKE